MYVLDTNILEYHLGREVRPECCLTCKCSIVGYGNEVSCEKYKADVYALDICDDYSPDSDINLQAGEPHVSM